MKEAVVTLTDGRTLTLQVDDGTTEAQIAEWVSNNTDKINSFRKPIESPEVGQSMSEGVSGFDRFMGGVGAGVTRLGLGAKDLAYDVLPDSVEGLLGLTEDKQNLQNQIELNRQIQQDISDSGLIGKAGNVVGEVLPWMMPGVNTLAMGVKGGMAAGSAYGALQPTLGDESRLTNTGYSAAGGAVGGYVGNKVGQYLDDGINAIKTRAVQNAPRDAVINEGRKLGYKLPPTQTNPSMINRALEGLGGKAATGQQAAVQNQQITQSLARKAIGLSDDSLSMMQHFPQLKSRSIKPMTTSRE